MGSIEHSIKPSDTKPAQPPHEFGREVLEFVERVEALSLFQDRITKPARIPQVWAAFQEEAARLVTSNASALYLVDPQSHAFELNQWSPDDCAAACRREIEAQIECGTFAWIVNRRQPAIIPSFVFRGAQNLVMLPLTTHARTLGVAIFIAAIEEQSVTHERLRLLGILSKQCALVMENTLLYDHLKTEHEALQAAQAQIIQAEKFASIGRLTSGAFHELLNPLNVISGHLQIMMMPDNVDSALHD
ncbi:MAG TPA: GAF domain-containing protein, partial [Desulfosarcina sp.]|nr:GAF domain-containing protein [Desulfosarcina sp.]